MAATMVAAVLADQCPEMAQPSTPDASSASVASSPIAVLPNEAGDAQAPPKSLGDALSSVAVANRKKRRRKKKGVLALDSSLADMDTELVEAEKRIGSGDDIGSWRARAVVRLDRLKAVSAEIESLKRELNDAACRADDARHAEQLVNTGLRDAHLLLAERDKALASSTSRAATLTAEVTTLTDEKRKIEKRLTLLKTVSEKLQEARDAKDAAERRADDAAIANSDLKKEIAQLENDLKDQADTVRALKADFGTLLAEHRAALCDAELAKVENEKRVHIAAGAGIAAGMVLSIIVGLISRVGEGEEDE